MKNINIKKLVLALILPQIAGFLGMLFVTPSLEGWYLTLNKPVFTPPNWLFAPAWTTLFILMGISLYFIYVTKSEDVKDRKVYLIFFYIQLFLNFFWNVLFFGLQNPLLGLIEIIVLIFTVGVTIFYGFKVKKISAYLLVPYILWLCFATALNIGVLVLN